MYARPSPGETEDRALSELVRQIADSDTFRMAPMMRALLLHLWEHRGEALSEYSIAVDALGRSADFDPKRDSTVRVQIARLRTKLRDFYAASGDSFPLQLSIPLGKHELVYVYSPEAPLEPRPKRMLPRTYTRIAVAALMLALAVTSAALWIENRGLRAIAPPPPAGLWQDFVGPGRSTLIVAPSPLLFHWPEHGVYLRDLKVSTFADWQKSPAIRELSRNWGAPELSQTYVGAMEMTGAVRLLQYLGRYSNDVQLIESRKFSTDDFGRRNTIFLGMPRTTAGYLDRLLSKTDFHLASVSPDIVRSRSPRPGEKPEFPETAYSPERRSYPAILALLPKRPEGTRSIILLGRNLLGVTSILLSPEGIAQIENEVAKHGSPDAWEMVVEAEIYRDAVLKAQPVAFRPIDGGFWKN